MNDLWLNCCVNFTLEYLKENPPLRVIYRFISKSHLSSYFKTQKFSMFFILHNSNQMIKESCDLPEYDHLVNLNDCRIFEETYHFYRKEINLIHTCFHSFIFVWQSLEVYIAELIFLLMQKFKIPFIGLEKNSEYGNISDIQEILLMLSENEAINFWVITII